MLNGSKLLPRAHTHTLVKYVGGFNESEALGFIYKDIMLVFHVLNNGCQHLSRMLQKIELPRWYFILSPIYNALVLDTIFVFNIELSL